MDAKNVKSPTRSYKFRLCATIANALNDEKSEDFMENFSKLTVQSSKFVLIRSTSHEKSIIILAFCSLIRTSATDKRVLTSRIGAKSAQMRF